jgi:hypothetical protein
VAKSDAVDEIDGEGEYEGCGELEGDDVGDGVLVGATETLSLAVEHKVVEGETDDTAEPDNWPDAVFAGSDGDGDTDELWEEDAETVEVREEVAERVEETVADEQGVDVPVALIVVEKEGDFDNDGDGEFDALPVWAFESDAVVEGDRELDWLEDAEGQVLVKTLALGLEVDEAVSETERVLVLVLALDVVNIAERDGARDCE